MDEKIAAFTQSVDSYLEYLKMPWARIIYEIIWRQLEGHFTASRQVLDIGCGFGLTALHFARSGHTVTGLEPTSAMLEIARQQAAEAGLAVEFLAGSLEAAPQLLAGRRFDWLICHNVLEYVAEPPAAIALLSGLLKPGGYLSLVNHNPVAKVLGKAIFERDPVLALQSLGSPVEYSKVIGTEIKVYPAEQLKSWLSEASFEVVAHYGVQPTYGYVTDNDLKQNPGWHKAALELELALGGISPYRDIARFHHFIARSV